MVEESWTLWSNIDGIIEFAAYGSESFRAIFLANRHHNPHFFAKICFRVSQYPSEGYVASPNMLLLKKTTNEKQLMKKQLMKKQLSYEWEKTE